MKILITGACGFIGSNLVNDLLNKNYKVKALTFYNSNNSIGCLSYFDFKNKNNLEIISGDIKDNHFVDKITKNVDVIFHLAALISIPYSYVAPKSYLDTNVYGTYNLLNSAMNNKVKKIFITSTSEVYGTAQSVPIKENHQLNAQSPYAASKIAADQLSMSFFKSFNLPVTILRPFNTFGPLQSSRAIIPTIINQIIDDKKIIKLGNLKPTRDLTFVKDTTAAFICALKAGKKIDGEIINIGSSFEISIKEILNILKKDFGYKFKVVQDKKRIRPKKSEVYRLFASNAKAKKMLNWKPNFPGINGFKKALKLTINFYKENQKISKEDSSNYNI
jgi:NAD dependent epimerase/dehydratase